MTGKELLLQKLKNYIETKEITKDDVLDLFDVDVQSNQEDEDVDTDYKEYTDSVPINLPGASSDIDDVIHLSAPSVENKEEEKKEDKIITENIIARELLKEDKINLASIKEEQTVVAEDPVFQEQRFVFLPTFILIVIVIVAGFALVQSWDEVTSTGRVISTLGSGVLGYILGMFLLSRKTLIGVLFHLIGAFLMPLGTLVAIDEFGALLDTQNIFIFLFSFLIMLYALSYQIVRHPLMIFLFISSAAGFLYGLLYALGVENSIYVYITLIIGALLVLSGHLIKKTQNASLAFPISFIGAMVFLGLIFVFLSSSTMTDILYAALLFVALLLALTFKIKGMFTAGMLFLFGYIFYMIGNYLFEGMGSILLSVVSLFAVIPVIFIIFYANRKLIGEA